MHSRTVWVTGCLTVALAATVTVATLSSRQRGRPADSPNPSPPAPVQTPQVPSGPIRIETVAPVSRWILAAGTDGTVSGEKAPQNGDYFLILPARPDLDQHHIQLHQEGACIERERTQLRVAPCAETGRQAFAFVPVGATEAGQPVFNIVGPEGKGVEMDTNGKVAVQPRETSRFVSRYILVGPQAASLRRSTGGRRVEHRDLGD